MAKFKQVPQTFLYRKLLEYWGNMVQNYRSDCQDDDFFDIIRNCFDHDKAVELIEAAYSPKELEEMRHAKLRSCRLDLTNDCATSAGSFLMRFANACWPSARRLARMPSKSGSRS